MADVKHSRPQVALFVTCLVDLMRPSVGFSAVKLLEAAGCDVAVPEAQTCCGQPAYNSGDKADAKAIARQTIKAFEGYDPPSITDYLDAPSLQNASDEYAEKAAAFANASLRVVVRLQRDLAYDPH